MSGSSSTIRMRVGMRGPFYSGDWRLRTGGDRMSLMRIALIAALAVQLAPAPANRHATVAAAPVEVGGKPGGKLSLFVDITPKAGIHVYAPGAKDYIAVSLKLNPGQ